MPDQYDAFGAIDDPRQETESLDPMELQYRSLGAIDDNGSVGMGLVPASEPELAALGVMEVPVVGPDYSKFGAIDAPETASSFSPTYSQSPSSGVSSGENAPPVLGFAPELALDLVAGVADFIPSKARGLRDTAQNVSKAISGNEISLGWLDNVSTLLDQSGKLRAEVKNHLISTAEAQAGKVGRTTAELVDATEQTLMMLGLFKKIGVPYSGQGPKATLATAPIRAAIATLTAEGKEMSLKDRAYMFGLSTAYMVTPALSGAFKGAALPKIADIALNMGITSTQYQKHIENAQRNAEASGHPEDSDYHLLNELILTHGGDVVFGAMTKSYRGAGTMAQGDKSPIDTAARMVEDSQRVLGEQQEGGIPPEKVELRRDMGVESPVAPEAKEARGPVYLTADERATESVKARTPEAAPERTAPTEPARKMPALVEELMSLTEKINEAGPNVQDSLLKRRDAVQKVFDTYLNDPEKASTPGMKRAVRILTGQVKVGELVPEYDALKGRMRGEQMAAKAGYREGKAEMAEKARQARIKALAKTEMRKMVGQIEKAGTSKSVALEYRDLIGEIKKGFDFKSRSGRTLAEIDSTRKFVERMEAQGETVDIPADRLALLEKVSLNNMTMDQLREVHATVMQIEHQGRIKNRLLTTQRNRAFNEIIDEQVKTIMKGTPLDTRPSVERGAEEAAKGKIARGKDATTGYITHQMRPELIIKTLDRGDSFGPNHKAIFEPLLNASNAKMDGLRSSVRKLSDIFEEQGIDIQKAETTRHVIDDKLTLTSNQAMDVYANTFNEHNLSVLHSSGLDDARIGRIVAKLSTSEKTAVRKAVTFFSQNQWARMEEAYSGLYGNHLGRVEGYWPIKGLESGRSTTTAINDEIRIAMEQRMGFTRPSAKIGELSSRVEHQRGIEDFDFFGKLYRTVASQEHFIAFAQPVRDVSKVFYNPKIRDAIKQAPQLPNGEEAYASMNKWLSEVAGGRETQAVSFMDRLASKITSNFAVAVLGANLTTIEKQPASMVQGMYYIGGKAALAGAVDFIKDPVAAWKLANEKSALVRNRWLNQERVMQSILEKRSSGAKFGQPKVMDRAREYSMYGVQAADKATVVLVWNSAYNKQLRLGKGDADAVKYADMVVRRTQPMSGSFNLPESMRGGAGSKWFMLFKNQLNQNLNLMIEAGLDTQFSDKTGIARGADNAGKIAAAYISTVVVPAIWTGIVTRKRFPDSGEIVEDIINASTGGAIYVGNIADVLVKAARKNLYGGAASVMAPAPLVRPVEEVARGVSSGQPAATALGIGVGAGELLGVPAVGVAGNLLRPLVREDKQGGKMIGRGGGRGGQRGSRGIGR